MRKIIFIFIISLLYQINNACAKEKIVLASDIWCPYICTPNSDFPGYMVEMARDIFAEFDIEVEVKITSWHKALKDAKNGKINGVLGAMKSDAYDFIFPETHQALDVTKCYIRGDEDWKYKDLTSLDGKKIGLILNYEYPYELSQYVIKQYRKNPKLFEIATGEEAVDHSVDNLISGKIDVYIENHHVMEMYLANKKHLEIKEVGTVSTTPEKLYIAFSPKNATSYDYVQFLNRGMADYKNSGKLLKLYQKYGIYQDVEKK